MGVRERSPAYRAFHLKGSNEVYAYEEKSTHARVICKFYGPKFGWDRDKAAGRAFQEYESLERLRAYNLVGSPHHVIRPLGLDRDIDCVLALEYYGGEQFEPRNRTLGASPRRCAPLLAAQGPRLLPRDAAQQDGQRQRGRLRHRLPVLRSARPQFQRKNRIGQWDVDELRWLRDLWHEAQMWQDQEVWLHGDATPANFLFGHGLDVAAIDLERGAGDRMFDIGRVAGELQHAFMASTGNRHRAEPFIGHFLWEYSCHFPDRDRAFESITARAPYYMAMNLLRVARNDYIGTTTVVSLSGSPSGCCRRARNGAAGPDTARSRSTSTARWCISVPMRTVRTFSGRSGTC